ncbi:MAG: hypothetical protein ACP5NE_00555 [Candidatus Micrarchaeia archaeon]
MLGKNTKKSKKALHTGATKARPKIAAKKVHEKARKPLAGSARASKDKVAIKTNRSSSTIKPKVKSTSEERKEAKEKQIIKTKKEIEERYKVDVKKVIEDITKNEVVMDYLRKNVSKRSEEVLKTLTSAKTDEQIAAELGVKINVVRRVLNILQGYGVTNYTTLKNSKGWLSFLWTINIKKVDEFYNYINSSYQNSVSPITTESDDYFICEKCYKDSKLIFDFDSAFEANFKCMGCGSSMKRLSREEAKILEKEGDIKNISSKIVQK